MNLHVEHNILTKKNIYTRILLLNFIYFIILFQVEAL